MQQRDTWAPFRGYELVKPSAAQTRVYQSGFRLINEADGPAEMSPSDKTCCVMSLRH